MYSKKMWGSSFSKNKAALKNSFNIRKGESSFEKKATLNWWLRLIETIFPEMFPHHDKYSWGILYIYQGDHKQPTKKSLEHFCIILSSILLKLYVSQTKKLSQFLLMVNISSSGIVSTLNTIVSLEDLLNF